MSSATDLEGWEGTDVSVAEVEQRLTALRVDSATDEPGRLRTSVMTHLAWVPPEWEQAAADTLAGLQERHPSRTILLLPQPEDSDGLDAEISFRCFSPAGLERTICSEVIALRLRGDRTRAPASIVAPLLLTDLPVFLRWRGQPPFGDDPFEQLVDLVDRLIVDSTEWPDLPDAYSELAQLFERTAVSDIAWERTHRWRAQLASLWPGIRSLRRLRVTGTAAQAHLLGGWLRSRLGRPVEVEHEPADRLVRVEVDGEPAPFPPGDPPHPSDVLSEQLDQFGRDPIYEQAVSAAA
jgi:glucose-6-phosphate dehydrogenase assembly protein OpcA